MLRFLRNAYINCIIVERVSVILAGALVAATILESLSLVAERTCYYELAAELKESSRFDGYYELFQSSIVVQEF